MDKKSIGVTATVLIIIVVYVGYMLISSQGNHLQFAASTVLAPPAPAQAKYLYTSHVGLTKTANSSRPSYVVKLSRVMGRLGNHMFMYASLFAVSRTNKRIFCFPTRSLLNGVFNSTQQGCSRSFNAAQGEFQFLHEKGSGVYDLRIQNLPPQNVEVLGYLQSFKYFRHQEDIIRRQFTFHPTILARARQMLVTMTKNRKFVTTVGVHIRRGDRVKAKPRYGGFVLPPPSYFSNAADFFRRRFKDVLFIVVSQDQKWCKKEVKMGNWVLAPKASAGQHMALLTLCQHTVMSIGSFGWWAGFLTGGQVVYYKDFIFPNLTARNTFLTRDHFPPSWIGLGAKKEI